MLSRIYSPAKREDGFTLIELLVVIIVIGILAAIAIPLFLDQRKLAVDASVKSDVRNTATQVQTWQASGNYGVVAADATAYTAAGGKVVSTGSNTVGVSVATDGTYLVCGYAGSSAKQYTATSAAYVFDSSTGKFGNGTCSGGIVGGGTPSSSTPTPSATTTTPAPAFAITTASLPAALQGTSYNSGAITTANGTAASYGATGLPAGLNINTTTGAISGTPTGSTNGNVVITATQADNTTATKSYTLKVNANLLTNGNFESGTPGNITPTGFTVYNPSNDGACIGQTWGGSNGKTGAQNAALQVQNNTCTLYQQTSTNAVSGNSYFAGVWIKAPATNDTVTGTLYLVSGGVVINSTNYSVSNSQGWVYVSAMGNAANNGALKWEVIPTQRASAYNTAMDDATLGAAQ